MTLPDPINHQDFLLTLDTSKLPWVKDALPGVDIHPLFLDPENGLWVIYASFKPGITLPMHFHTGTVHFYTTSGCWYYLEYPDEKQTAGCYLYEPGGSVHTFHTPEDNEGPTEGIMMVQGANVNFDADGNYMGMMDAGWIEEAVVAAAKAQGLSPLRYIKPKRGAGFSDEE
jgi:quercetin dioxygenase-like cupin family protein